MIVHILIESISPPEATIWTMYCDHECIALDDGETIPETDFVHERDGSQADCAKCQSEFRRDLIGTKQRALADAICERPRS